VLLLGLRGTPFLYQGEELGLEDAVVPEDRVVDPGGRDGCRAPVPWTRAGGHGWGADPWLPFPPHAGERSVEARREDPTSILHLYRRLLAARRASDALALGDQRLLDVPDGVVGIERTSEDGDDRRVVLVSFTDVTSARLSLPTPPHGEWIVEVSTDGEGEGKPFTGALGPDQAVVLR
jgi:alpha-glucosidase